MDKIFLQRCKKILFHRNEIILFLFFGRSIHHIAFDFSLNLFEIIVNFLRKDLFNSQDHQNSEAH